MREFQKVLAELKELVAHHKVGDTLQAPSHLNYVTINGRKVHYAAMGREFAETRKAGVAPGTSKPSVILLHGFGGFFMDWPRVMAPLSRHTDVYALDLPGWGFSEINTESSALEDEVSVVDQFIKALGLESVVLCGISYGGGVAWASAATGISRLKRAVLLNPMAPNPIDWISSPIYQGIFALNKSRAAAFVGHKMLRKAHYKMICRENLLNERLLDTFYLDLAYLVMKQPKMPLILNAHARGAEETDWASWEHRLAGCRIPVSILQGREDKIFSMESAQHLHDLIPHSELIEVSDCGHAMVFDQPKRVADFLIECLDRDSATTRVSQSG